MAYTPTLFAQIRGMCLPLSGLQGKEQEQKQETTLAANATLSECPSGTPVIAELKI